MPFDDRTSDDSFAARSLSEQLQELEAELGHEPEQKDNLSLPRVARRATLPTHLGRPIGLTRPDGFPRLTRLMADAEARAHQPEPAPSPGAAFRRGATVVGVGLLLLATTAIVPPLFLRHQVPNAAQPSPPAQVVTVARIERFAQAAQELRDAGPGAVSSMQPLAQPQPVLSQPTSARYEPTAGVGEATIDALFPSAPR